MSATAAGTGPPSGGRNLGDVLRLRAWYMAFFGPVEIWYFSVFYLSIATGFQFSGLTVTALVVSLMLYEAWGVLLNDVFDKQADSLAGKSGRERGHRLGAGVMAGLVVGTAAGNWALVLLLKPEPVYVAAWAVAYALGTFYSAPPLRLKNRGVLSFFCNSVLERPIPVVLIFLFFGRYGAEIVVFPVLSELVWSVFKHQVHDYEKDLKAGLRTFAVMLGRDISYRVVRSVVNPLSVVSVITFALIAAAAIAGYSWVFVTSAALVAAGVAGMAVLGGRSRVYSDPLDPPYILFLNFAFVVALVAPMAAVVLVKQVAYLPVVALFVLSLPPYFRYYGPLVLKLVRALAR